jgi:hypothetical protein
MDEAVSGWRLAVSQMLQEAAYIVAFNGKRRRCRNSAYPLTANR